MAERGGHCGDDSYLDQNVALRWIHENIAVFGGDASRMVLADQSFGAGSVVAHVMSPLSKGQQRADAI